MSEERRWTALYVGALVAMIIGGAGCIVSGIIDPSSFFPAWLAAFLFWVSVPLSALALVLVHDLTGGRWMATARPVLEAAIATMPVGTLAFLPLLLGLGHLYTWSEPGHPGLGNEFYLNDTFFIGRYAVYFVIWNFFAFYALWWPRNGAVGVAPAVSWVSGIGLLLLAYSVTFASFDWIMSTEPHFWSSIFGMVIGAGKFNTGLALVLLAIALRGPATAPSEKAYRDDLADITSILLATIIFWAYTEYVQFLIIWEENLKSEITWYLHRWAGAWHAVMYTIVVVDFLIPFLVLIWRPSKRSRLVVGSMCALLLVIRLAYEWWLILPEYPRIGFDWPMPAAVFAIGGLLTFLLLWRLRHGHLLPERATAWAGEGMHG
jgi:hypothetical protein